MMPDKSQNKKVYQLIRSIVPLKNYCESCGVYFRRIGKSYRANSPFTNGKDAFSIDVDNLDFWHDYSVVEGTNHGDVVDFSAMYNHDGNKNAALLELIEYLPTSERERVAGEINKYIKDRDEVQKKITQGHEALISGRYTLTQHWIPYLNSRGVSDEQINRLKLGLDMNGFRLIIPRFNFDGVEVLDYKMRRMPNEGGKENNDEPKYKSAYKGENTFLRSAPLGLWTLNRNSKYLILCEGDFDTLNFEREGFAVLGSGGGAFSGEQWPLILSEAQKFEAVVLAFDNDKPGIEFTKEAGKKLFEKRISFRVIDIPCEYKGSKIKDVNDFYVQGGSLAEFTDDAIDGLEFLALQFAPAEGFEKIARSKSKEIQNEFKKFLITAMNNGADKPDIIDLCNRLGNAYPKNWLIEVQKQAEKGECEYDIVEAICAKHELMYNARTGFYEYQDKKGVWIQLDDKAVGAFVRTYLGRSTSAKKIYSVTEHLKAAVISNEPVDALNRLPLFAFKNGTLHMHGEGRKRHKEEDLFKSASDKDFVTNRLDYDYDPDALCPQWEQALSVIFAGNEKRIACFQEFCGYCLIPHCRYEKALILRDPDKNGSNGKSTLLEILRAVLGDENTTSLEPRDFADEHSVIFLKDAKVNICSDANPDVAGGDTNLRKAITGKDKLRGRFLYKDAIEFTNAAKIIFSVNGNLKMKDKTGAMMRRFLLIDFPVRFVDEPTEGNSNEAKKDFNIKGKLMQERAGIFNWILAGANRLIRQGGHFTLTEEHMNELESVFQVADNKVQEFIEEVRNDFYDEAGHGKQFTRGEIYAMYIDYCENLNDSSKPIDASRFHEKFRQELKNLGIQYKEKQKHGSSRYYDFLVPE